MTAICAGCWSIAAKRIWAILYAFNDIARIERSPVPRVYDLPSSASDVVRFTMRAPRASYAAVPLIDWEGHPVVDVMD